MLRPALLASRRRQDACHVIAGGSGDQSSSRRRGFVLPGGLVHQRVAHGACGRGSGSASTRYRGGFVLSGRLRHECAFRLRRSGCEDPSGRTRSRWVRVVAAPAGWAVAGSRTGGIFGCQRTRSPDGSSRRGNTRAAPARSFGASAPRCAGSAALPRVLGADGSGRLASQPGGPAGVWLRSAHRVSKHPADRGFGGRNQDA